MVVITQQAIRMYPVSLNGVDRACVMGVIIDNPTPGSPRPAKAGERKTMRLRVGRNKCMIRENKGSILFYNIQMFFNFPVLFQHQLTRTGALRKAYCEMCRIAMCENTSLYYQ